VKRYIGMDVGILGGFAELSDEGVTVAPMPAVGDVLSLTGIKDWLISRLALCPTNRMLIGIEKVEAIHGSAAGATFQFGQARMALEMAAVMLSIPYIFVPPKQWQAVFFAGGPVIKKPGKDGKDKNDTKKMARLAAERLYPDVDLLATERSKVPHSGIVDALGIAHYLKTQNL
jgi:hypothetical protein